MADQLATIVENAIETISLELRKISLEIHSNPELGNNEKFAHKILTEYLTTKGFQVSPCVSGLETAFRAEFVNVVDGKPGRTVSFNSEYDCLPKIGHACGHNLIAISGVAAAYAVKVGMITKGIPGKVVLFGTPAEETLTGKIPMIKAGAYKNVDVCLMAHPASIDTVGPIYLSSTTVTVEYFGRPAHAAGAPWQGKNALDAVVTAYNLISVLRQQILPSNRIHMIITKGGDVINVIPANAQIKIGLRTEKISELEELKIKVQACYESIATATGCSFETNWGPQTCDVQVNENLAKRFSRYMSDRGVQYLPDDLKPGKGFGGSTDMGNVTYEVPGIHAVYNIDTKNMIHTAEFEKDAKTEKAHTATLRVSKCLGLTAIDVLVDDEFYNSVKEEFLKGPQ
ncbi:hypothetical protein G9A89_006951 [Geosiphon pyriformis]|nr:hypothetical protein G9A89_006951 [Geosiphon pyriformis]